MSLDRRALCTLSLALALALGSCDPSEIVGDCRIVTDNFTSSYAPGEQKSHSFQVGCAGSINVFWACPQCPDPNAGRLVLLDPLGTAVFQIPGAGFGGARRQISTLFEGRWTLLIQGTGGNFINNYSVDVTYPEI